MMVWKCAYYYYYYYYYKFTVAIYKLQSFFLDMTV